MNLTLEVISANGSSLGAARSKVFGAAGGKIGRGTDCDWVLPSPSKYVSRHHASILFANGTYYIRAEGQNEVAVNDPNLILTFGKLTPIRHRDRVFIDEYEILANLVAESARGTPLIGDPFAEEAQPLIPVSDPFDTQDLDPLNKLPSLPERPGARDRYTGPPPGDVLSERLVLPTPVESAPAIAQDPGFKYTIPGPARFESRPQTPAPVPAASFNPIPINPEAWDKTTYGHAPPQKPESVPIQPSAQEVNVAPADSIRRLKPAPIQASPDVAPPSRPQPQPRTLTPSPANLPLRGGLDLDSLLRAAGVDPQNVDPEIAATLGQIFKMVVQGTIDALRARDEVKSQFRLAVTRVKTRENNPLAFSVDAADAINSMLVRRNPAFLSPVEAFHRAFDDIRAHQVAMIAGMRAGFESLMNQFDPEELKERFDKQAKRGGLLGVVAKPDHWVQYADYFTGLRGDRDDAFRRLFGDEFANAYEKQIELLKRGAQRSR